MMLAVRLLLCLLLLGVVAQAQHQASSYSITVRQTGSDLVGTLLRRAMEQKFKIINHGHDANAKNGTQDYVELVTLESDPLILGKHHSSQLWLAQ